MHLFRERNEKEKGRKEIHLMHKKYQLARLCFKKHFEHDCARHSVEILPIMIVIAASKSDYSIIIPICLKKKGKRLQTIMEWISDALGIILVYGVMLYGIYTIPVAIIIGIICAFKKRWWIVGICTAFLVIAFIEAEIFVRSMNS